MERFATAFASKSSQLFYSLFCLIIIVQCTNIFIGISKSKVWCRSVYSGARNGVRESHIFGGVKVQAPYIMQTAVKQYSRKGREPTETLTVETVITDHPLSTLDLPLKRTRVITPRSTRHDRNDSQSNALFLFSQRSPFRSDRTLPLLRRESGIIISSHPGSSQAFGGGVHWEVWDLADRAKGQVDDGTKCASTGILEFHVCLWGAGGSARAVPGSEDREGNAGTRRASTA
jgi:hypothetical protein